MRHIPGERELELPELPSELLRLALRDLELVELQGSDYMVDMRSWHVPSDGVCRVCLAGAVLTRHMSPRDYCVDPDGMFGYHTLVKLTALDLFRCGRVRLALEVMDYRPTLHDRTVPDYDEDPAGFRHFMRVIIDELAACGL